MNTFTADRAAALPGPDWLRRRRTDAFDVLAHMPMPSEKEEVWRYTPIDELDLDSYRPVTSGEADGPLSTAFRRGIEGDVPARRALVWTRDGAVASVERSGLAEEVVVGPLAALGDEPDVLGHVLTGGDALVRLNDAFHLDTVVVDVPAGTVVEEPIVVVHWCGGSGAHGDDRAGPASFPRTLVRLGRGASAGVVEVVAGPPDATGSLVVPVVELTVGDGAQLSYVGLQVVGPKAWHIGRVSATTHRDATLRTFTVGLGGSYDRSRTDAVAAGAGSSTELRSAYLGTGVQVHDVRTLQDHVAPHTMSDLLCKGAVAGSSRSVYSGLIRVRRGAVRTDAFQTNNNLVLGRSAHADSVPNLDIQENDVRCSHASTVGPVDEDQRYYLESRGVPPERAEQLIVLGFFDDIIERSPVPAAVPRLRREVGLRLAEALHLGGSDG
jgi:Fe-S cluster assembly protein SufD